MKNIKSLFFLLVLGLGITYAQSSFNINPFPRSEPLKLNAQDSLKVLAVMVEFKQDNDGNTFGNGKFGSIYTQDYGNDILDPLPHNAEYFKGHLKFAQNYFEKVSNGNVNLDYTVLPNIVTVSKIMREYSPEINSNEFTPIGEFAEEVWALTDAAYPGIDFSDYDLFTIFHAGVGREIPTPGSIGLERDLPSVYLSENALKDIFGNEFDGFSVNDGNYKISNTMILPTTENREIESFGDVFLQEFSINGLIVSSIASHLGLPDLFNTETGRSAIGRFGLMDGQAIFAYRGLFPPEPSPWEKMYLGWIEPVTLNLTNQNVTITADEIASAADTVLVKIPINSTEYYLIENRKRDANKDGVILTYKVGNSESTISFTKDVESFSPFTADTISGVVTDVDEFDWAVPGFQDNQSFDDPFEDIGFVIWHIDESVINANIETNTINNDRERLGVRVIEADGIFDIGEEFVNIFGETILGEGTKQDTWYESNPSRLYENVFDQNSEPPAVTNQGANSLIEISNISGISNRMSFSLRYGNNNITKISQTELNITDEIKNLFTLDNSIAVHAANDLYIYDYNGNYLDSYNNISSVKPAVFVHNGITYFTGVLNDTLVVVGSSTQNLPVVSKFDIAIDGIASSPVIISPNPNDFDIFFGTETGNILKYKFDDNAAEKITLVETINGFENLPVRQVVYNSNLQSIHAVAGNLYWDSVTNGVISFGGNIKKFSVTDYSPSGIVSYMAIVLEEGNKISFIASGNVDGSFTVESSLSLDNFLLTDLKSDGNKYAAYSIGKKIDAYNLNGGRGAFFPVDFDINGTFNGSDLAIDLDGNGFDDIISFDSDGNIYSVDGRSGELSNGFPFSSGDVNKVYPALQNSGQIRLVAVNNKNELNVWSLGAEAEFEGWMGELGNSYNNSYAMPSVDDGEVTEYFPVDKAYNWPNPVYEGETYIRFYVSENSQAVVRIFDLAGDLVDELTHSATGGVDNEIPWNVNDIQSGVYFAHLEVSRNSGESENKIIKIAVIK